MVSSLESDAPPGLWSSSLASGTLGTDLDRRPSWGESVDFTCPDGKKPSFDDDGVAQNDDLFSVVCLQDEVFAVR